MASHTSLDAIAKLVGGEGFTEHAANEVKRYWLRRAPKTKRARDRLRQIGKAFTDMVKEKLDERDKIVLGKHISVLLKAQFDTGLRLGLMTLAATLQAHDQPPGDGY